VLCPVVLPGRCSWPDAFKGAVPTLLACDKAQPDTTGKTSNASKAAL